MKHYGYIYKTTLPHGFYIGRKKSATVVDDYFGSGVCIYRYVEKHGTRGLKREILAWADSENDLNELEILFIAEGKNHRDCLNLHDGGGSWDVINRLGLGGGKAFEEHNKRIKTDPEYKSMIMKKAGDARSSRLDKNALEFANLYQSGLSATLIANKFGVSIQLVIRSLKLLEFDLRPSWHANAKFNKLPKDEVFKLYSDGWSLSAICSKFGVRTLEPVKRVLRDFGIVKFRKNYGCNGRYRGIINT